MALFDGPSSGMCRVTTGIPRSGSVFWNLSSVVCRELSCAAMTELSAVSPKRKRAREISDAPRRHQHLHRDRGPTLCSSRVLVQGRHRNTAITLFLPPWQVLDVTFPSRLGLVTDFDIPRGALVELEPSPHPPAQPSSKCTCRADSISQWPKLSTSPKY